MFRGVEIIFQGVGGFADFDVIMRWGLVGCALDWKSPAKTSPHFKRREKRGLPLPWEITETTIFEVVWCRKKSTWEKAENFFHAIPTSHGLMLHKF